MKIDKNLILKLEKLSRLELTEEERDIIKKDLGDILIMVEKLHELDTENVEPLRYMSVENQPPREDKIASQDIREAVLTQSPLRKDNFFAIPKVINK